MANENNNQTQPPTPYPPAHTKHPQPHNDANWVKERGN